MDRLIGAFLGGALALHSSVSAQAPGRKVGADAESYAAPTSSSFAAESPYRYLTSDPYGRKPRLVFPADPVDFYQRREAALTLAYSEDCVEAAPRLNELVREYQDDSELWFFLGLCQSKIGERKAALEALRQALELGTAQFNGRFDAMPAEVMLKIAWLHAEGGEVDEALASLRRALDARYANRPSLAQAAEASLLQGYDEFDVLAGVAPEGSFSREERWRYDIEFLREQVKQLHFDPDHHSPAGELERYLQVLSDEVSSLTDEQIVARLSLFMGRLGAGHDVLFIDSAPDIAVTPFALRVYFFTDGLYIIDADVEALVGSRIEAFGDVPTETAFEIFAAAVSRDNNMTPRWSAPRYLMHPVMLEALGIVDNADSATLTITDREGRKRVISPGRRSLAPTQSALVPPALEAPLYLSRLQSRYWTQQLKDFDALYVQVNGLSDAEGEDFVAFVERVGREAAAADVHDLILDLRHNSGGIDGFALRLLRALVHFDMEPDKGDLYVLIGRNTFSAAQILITKIELLTDAVFVGEPSSSRPNFIGRVGQFSLPFSGLSGFISSDYAQNSSPEDHRVWTAPDVPVGLSSQDYFAGRDPALEAIIALIERAE